MRTLSQLVGTASANSFTTYPSSFTTLSQNNSAANVAYGTDQVNNAHRYLLQKYFDNERTVTTTTVGGMSLTTTASLVLGATSATLTASWTYPTCTQLVTFSNGQQISVQFQNGSTAISWATPLTGTATTAITTVGVQDYNIPANISKIKNDTINVGQLKYQPIPVMTRAEWDMINFLPYTSDIPQYYFIYNGKLSIFPIPSTTGNIITFNFQTRVADMSYSDYQVGTLATMTAGSTAVTGTSTLWTAFPQNVDLTSQNLFLRADVATGGDGIWYQIQKFTSATALTLVSPVVNAPNISASTTYTIGQIPLLSEDFHDMLTYSGLMIYFSTIKDEPEKYKQFENEYNKRLVLLEAYAGTKQISVDLGNEPNMTNPNLFLFAH